MSPCSRVFTFLLRCGIAGVFTVFTLLFTRKARNYAVSGLRVHAVHGLFILIGQVAGGICSLFNPFIRGEHEHPTAGTVNGR